MESATLTVTVRTGRRRPGRPLDHRQLDWQDDASLTRRIYRRRCDARLSPGAVLLEPALHTQGLVLHTSCTCARTCCRHYLCPCAPPPASASTITPPHFVRSRLSASLAASLPGPRQVLSHKLHTPTGTIGDRKALVRSTPVHFYASPRDPFRYPWLCASPSAAMRLPGAAVCARTTWAGCRSDTLDPCTLVFWSP